MFKILRIIFTILSVACVVPVVFLGIYLGIGWAILCALAAAALFGLAALFKTLQRKQEERENPPPPPGDFFAPAPKREPTQSDKDGANEP